MRPSDFPPPFDSAEALAPSTDPEDERIEVGVCIVGAGPAGLACAIRLGQLLESAPAVAERLGEVPANFEPGSDVLARITVLAEGTQGHLTGAAIQGFGLGGQNPQVWALGVKEVWRVAKPLRRVIHTLGWPLRAGAKYREFGGCF